LLRANFLLVAFALFCFQGCSTRAPAVAETAPVVAPTPPPPPEPLPLHSLDDYKELLRARGQVLDDQGIVVETLDGAQTLAEHNADTAFNPASVMKLATSLVALKKLGPDYRYRTNVLADGPIDQAARKLDGDLVFEGNADPMFATEDAQEVAERIAKLGISRVTGRLRIAGPFYYFAVGYHSNLSRETSAAKLRGVLQRAGIRIDGPNVFGEKSGTLLLSHFSDELIRVLLYQNAHSSNAIAEVIGESLGGPQAIQEYLIRQIGLRDSDIYVGRTSGLQFNRITPRAALKVLRVFIESLAGYALKPQDAMPVAGVDTGTLRGRLSRDELRGTVVAKTGTLSSVDNGVSTLVGIAYTKARGPLLFAVFNSTGGVLAFRRLQDEFVERVIEEAGGPAFGLRTDDALADFTRHTIIQMMYRKGNSPVDASAD
jgi:D-alanyl-D-alanine carboxypeptidase/D-alanyl-D-alanine-endopeptidase (penicillin-binding protein 4)